MWCWYSLHYQLFLRHVEENFKIVESFLISNLPFQQKSLFFIKNRSKILNFVPNLNFLGKLPPLHASLLADRRARPVRTAPVRVDEKFYEQIFLVIIISKIEKSHQNLFFCKNFFNISIFFHGIIIKSKLF